MPSKAQVSKLLPCVWCKCVYPSAHAGVMPCIGISHSRHSAGAVSACATWVSMHDNPVQGYSTTSSAVTHSGRAQNCWGWPRSAHDAQVLSWDTKGCLALAPVDSVPAKTLRKCSGPYHLTFKFRPYTKAMWWTHCRGAMMQEAAYLWIWASKRPEFRHQLCQLLTVNSLLWACFLVRTTWDNIYTLPET